MQTLKMSRRLMAPILPQNTGMAGVARLRGLWRTALEAVDPESLVARWLSARPGETGGRRGLFACGKAAIAMAAGARNRPCDAALVIAPDGAEPPRWFSGEFRTGAHPEPDRSSVEAARAALSFFRRFGAGDSILALISGGASSLLCLPRAGLTLSEKRDRIRRATREGLPIERLNRLRTSLSAIKGGRLAEATAARVTTLVLSDVPGADFRLVGSGPTISAKKKRDRAILLADNRTGVAAAAERARRDGARVRVLRRPIEGEARVAGSAFARELRALAGRSAGPAYLLGGGETTVAIGTRAGRGGRNQEFALGAAREIDGDEGLAVLAAGSDGVDGNSDAAGAFVTGATIARGRRDGIDAAAILDRHDSQRFFDRVGGALRTGATGTNVADWMFGFASPRGARR
jgi:glycerate-2-kinase